jgi:hypothetical protein
MQNQKTHIAVQRSAMAAGMLIGGLLCGCSHSEPAVSVTSEDLAKRNAEQAQAYQQRMANGQGAAPANAAPANAAMEAGQAAAYQQRMRAQGK